MGVMIPQPLGWSLPWRSASLPQSKTQTCHPCAQRCGRARAGERLTRGRLGKLHAEGESEKPPPEAIAGDCPCPRQPSLRDPPRRVGTKPAAKRVVAPGQPSRVPRAPAASASTGVTAPTPKEMLRRNFAVLRLLGLGSGALTLGG